jgi:hypothetical protein
VYILATDCQFWGERFCFVLNNSRPLSPLETAFFETARLGKGFYNPIVQFPVYLKHLTIPVIAIFTKFDDLITQIYDIDQDDDVNRQHAEEQVEIKFRIPLYEYTFPPPSLILNDFVMSLTLFQVWHIRLTLHFLADVSNVLDCACLAGIVVAP